jgi:hypothetical protein
MSITFSESLKPLVFSMQSACALLYCHLWPVRPCDIFRYYLSNGKIFRGGKGDLLNIKCVFRFFLHNFCLKHFSFEEEFRDTLSQMYICLHVNNSLFVSEFNEIWNFYTDFRNIFKCHTSWRSVQWEQNCYMWTDGQRGMTKLIVAFLNFVNAPKM